MKGLPVLIIMLLIVTASYAQDAVGRNAQEKKVLKLINELPEIKKENARRQKLGVKHLLKAFIQNTPTKEKKYYSVSVGEDLGDQLRTYDWYTVNPKTFVIKYDDIIEGKSISLAEWRKRLKHKK